MTRRIAVLFVAVAALALPSVAAAHDGKGKAKSPAQQCRAERAQMGADAFKAKYGTNSDKSNAFGKCVSKKKAQARRRHQGHRSADQTNANDRSPAQQCRAERDKMGVDAFKAKYGTNDNKANAFGKCVSQKARAQKHGQSGDHGQPGDDNDRGKDERADDDHGEGAGAPST